LNAVRPNYAALTRDDPSPLKRVVHSRRLVHALAMARDLAPGVIVDYGSGDGALCQFAAEVWPDARIICFEPAPHLASEARMLLAGTPQAQVVSDEGQLPSASVDLVFCTEVLEHLPPAETERALDEIARILRPGARTVIGVPIEVGPPALAKGVFRAMRRPGEFDSRPEVVAGSLVGRPPRGRPASEISPGRAYFPHHAGFDHRPLFRAVAARLAVERRTGSPLPYLPAWLNSEVYVRARRRA
jgi:SAM-dependent methyltransferase